MIGVGDACVSRSHWRMARVASNPSISGILQVHEDDVIRLSYARVDRFGARADDRDAVSVLFEHTHREALVGQAVFGQQHTQRRECAPGRWRRGRRVRRRRYPHNRLDGFEKLRVLHRLEQTRRHARGLETRVVTRPCPRCEQDDLRIAEPGVLPQREGQVESIGLRHLHVRQHQPHRISVSGGTSQLVERRFDTGCGVRPKPPAATPFPPGSAGSWCCRRR